MNDSNAPGEKRRMSFRTQLTLFGLLLVLIVSVPVAMLEMRRPWDALRDLMGRAKIVVANVRDNFAPEDLDRMNAVALKVNEVADPENEDYLIWSFNFALEGDELPSEEELKKMIEENEVEAEDFDYAKLSETFAFWKETLQATPETLSLFKQYKQTLIDARESSKSADFEFSDVYVMADDGKKLMFLVDGSDWYDSSYPGLEYDVIENDCPHFRGYLEKGPGFDSDPLHYKYGILPKFNTDQWGTWFSVWYAIKQGDVYNNFALDFDAVGVMNLMRKIAMYGLAGAVLILLVVILITNRLSGAISEPIGHLVSGTEAVMNHDYDHVVPDVGGAEFHRFTVVFNNMIHGLKERLNLMQTLKKLLSDELAEQVAKHGMVLGGQKVHISNMFTDFAGFSGMSRKVTPQEVVNMLNDYFSVLIPVMKKWGGFTDKFIGDAIVGIFGAPVYLQNHAEHAVSCAIEMQLTMRSLNEKRRKEGKPVLEMRIGINTGDVIAGAIGSDVKLEYTSIGETTNLAQRMESACAIGHILITQATYEDIKGIFFDGVDFEETPSEMRVKGYEEVVLAYNIFVSDLDIEKNEDSETTLDFYHYRQANKKLKKASELSEDRKKQFNKIVSIKAGK